MYPTDLTVAAVIEHDSRYLLVEEQAMGLVVLGQPGGHIEKHESPEAAVEREVLEETGCAVACRNLIGVYLWIHPQNRQQFLRLVYAADFIRCDESLPLDEGIVARKWLTRDEIAAQRPRLRTPAVLRCVEDYEAGRREPNGLLSRLMPLSSHVDRVLARADLV